MAKKIKSWELDHSLMEYIKTIMDMIHGEEDAAQTVVTVIANAFDDISKNGKLDFEEFNQYILASINRAKLVRNKK